MITVDWEKGVSVTWKFLKEVFTCLLETLFYMPSRYKELEEVWTCFLA